MTLYMNQGQWLTGKVPWWGDNGLKGVGWEVLVAGGGQGVRRFMAGVHKYYALDPETKITFPLLSVNALSKSRLPSRKMARASHLQSSKTRSTMAATVLGKRARATEPSEGKYRMS